MEFLVDFLESNALQDSKIFPHLKCDEQEAQILQNLLKNYLYGENICSVSLFLSKYYGEQEYKTHFELLPKIYNLIEMGWVTQLNSDDPNSMPMLMLELYNERISLSYNFLRLLEGYFDDTLPEISAYTSDLEYLKDQFKRIDLLHKTSRMRQDSLSLSKNSLKLLEDRISARLKLTKKQLSLIKFFKTHKLNQKEQTIFLALLKEEYFPRSMQNMRDANALMHLISNDEYEKMANLELLSEDSKLLSKGLIDYDEYLSGFGNIDKSFFIPNEILHIINNPTKKPKHTKITLESLVKNQEIFELLEPKSTLEEVILSPNTKETLKHILAQVDSVVINRLKLWGIKESKNIEAKILFFGPPGTGKTLSAMALAKSLKKEVLSFDCSKILSAYVGESEKNVRLIFDTYKEMCKKVKSEPILFLDEADQFLSSRGGAHTSTDKMHNQMQNIFLEQIERFEGILIATTNLLENFDKAFSRRFNYKIEFKGPNKEQRQQLWEHLLPTNITLNGTREAFIAKFCESDLSGGQIKLVVRNTAYKVATREDPIFCMQDFEEEIKKELNANFDNQKSVGFRRE